MIWCLSPCRVCSSLLRKRGRCPMRGPLTRSICGWQPGLSRLAGRLRGTISFRLGCLGPDGMPNRVVASFPSGLWAKVAPDIVRTAEDMWRGWVGRALKLGRAGAGDAGHAASAMGVVPSGRVVMPRRVAAREWVAARRRTRDFPAVEWRERELCGAGPRWPAEPVPGGLRAHEEVPLSAAAWVKRRWRQIHHLDGFPSTASIASAPFRSEVLARLDDPEVLAVVRDLADAAREVIR